LELQGSGPKAIEWAPALGRAHEAGELGVALEQIDALAVD
jgi:hypothetical protein